MGTLHEYPVTVNWQGGRDGHGEATAAHSGKQFPLRVPPEFSGPGGETNPEELLTSAVASCYSITFGIIAANRKLPVESFEVSAVGVVEQQGMSFTYKQITIRPKIKVVPGTTEAQIEMLLDQAHKVDAYCIVTNAVRGKVEILVEPSVSV